MGMVCTYLHTLAHGPPQYGGLDIPHLYTEQLISHVHTVLCYGPDWEDHTGHLLHINGKAMHLKLGHSGELLATPLCLQDNITNLWLKHVWLSMQECRITLLMDFADYSPSRHGDLELM